jgi:hypothetical protein
MKPRWVLVPDRHNAYALMFMDVNSPFGGLTYYLMPRHAWALRCMGINP